MVDVMLWSILNFWIGIWIYTLIIYNKLRPDIRVTAEFKYGLIDVLGLLALIGITIRNW